MEKIEFKIRKYQEEDRESVRRICCDTGFWGKPMDPIYQDRECLAGIIVDPYLDIYHQLRIDVKILRYTIEFFREILGQEAKGLIKDLKALQDNLGDIHDTVVALDLLEKFKSFGTWGKVNKDNNSLISDIPSYQGVENYIEYRKSELDDLATRFPQMWSKVLDPYFNIRLSKAISDIYIS